MGHKEHDTPKKARFRGAYTFLTAHGYKFKRKDLYEFFDISERTGRELLKDPYGCDRTRHNNPDLPETRGRKRKVVDEDAVDENEKPLKKRKRKPVKKKKNPQKKTEAVKAPNSPRASEKQTSSNLLANELSQAAPNAVDQMPGPSQPGPSQAQSTPSGSYINSYTTSVFSTVDGGHPYPFYGEQPGHGRY
ncbi:HMG box protein [Colletotrichum scovillei]|uniref:HMG box protein n=1 Tax=Colletotrichum scovillei TaxID=1209932 RepID=A0A9P7RJQ8_9PEZI|nr:HMG box protein [Colletotrichum scovillei]KAG7077405.1 HMG box protein [Colletotrichum scovillei]KAG7084490.1 HMG box protein [Colletotrichum scovillei]